MWSRQQKTLSRRREVLNSFAFSRLGENYSASFSSGLLFCSRLFLWRCFVTIVFFGGSFFLRCGFLFRRLAGGVLLGFVVGLQSGNQLFHGGGLVGHLGHFEDEVDDFVFEHRGCSFAQVPAGLFLKYSRTCCSWPGYLRASCIIARFRSSWRDLDAIVATDFDSSKPRRTRRAAMPLNSST